MWIISMGNHGVAVGISECRRSSFSSYHMSQGQWVIIQSSPQGYNCDWVPCTAMFPRLLVTAVLGDRHPAELHFFRNYDPPGVNYHRRQREDKFEPVPRPNGKGALNHIVHRIFKETLVNTMPADVLTPCIRRPSSSLIRYIVRKFLTLFPLKWI